MTAGRDFTVERYLDVATIAEGDPCPRCGEPLVIGRAIEIGHIFQLGRKYTNAFELYVLGPDGTPVRVTMGSYGIGVSRAVASIIEQNPRRSRADLAGGRRPCRHSPDRHRQGGPERGR